MRANEIAPRPGGNPTEEEPPLAEDARKGGRKYGSISQATAEIRSRRQILMWGWVGKGVFVAGLWPLMRWFEGEPERACYLCGDRTGRWGRPEYGEMCIWCYRWCGLDYDLNGGYDGWYVGAAPGMGWFNAYIKSQITLEELREKRRAWQAGRRG